MPVIVTKRPGSCSGCGGRIGKGEYAVYTLVTGAIHPECVNIPATRTNAHRTACSECGRVLEPGEATLRCEERRKDDGTYVRRWVATCLGLCR